MKRLLLLALLASASAKAPSRAPTEVLRLNHFAEQYNVYTQELHRGVVDVKQWERVTRAWMAIAAE